MESFLIKERYKVTYVLYAQQDYAALQAVDIQSREKDAYLLNVYEGEYRKSYLRVFHDLRGCGQFREMFLWEDSLVAVFDYREGLAIDQVFFKGAQVDWRFRLEAAQALFHLALSVSACPPQISCAAMLSDNIHVFPTEGKLGVSYVVRPLEGMNQRELVLLLTDQIQKVLLHRWDSPPRERRFVRSLCRGTERSAAAVYGKWTAEAPAIRAEYEMIEKKAALARWLYLLFMNLRDWAEGRFKRKGS